MYNAKGKRLKNLMFVLFAIIIVLIIVVVVLLLGGKSCNPTDNPSTQPPVTEGANNTVTPTEDASQPTGDPATDLPTQEPTTDPEIPLAVTEGTMSDVYARLEQLKTLPEDAVIILLDVGHGGFDGGAVGIDTNVHEADLNLQVSRILAQKLAEKGYYVFITRMGDYALASSKSADMEARTAMMKLDIFDVSVSIHMNSFPDDRSVAGTRLYHYTTGTEGERLAEVIMERICAAQNKPYKSTTTGDLMVVREPVAPSALVECGFLSNHDEELLLQDVTYQNLLAQAIADGVEAFLNGDPGRE